MTNFLNATGTNGFIITPFTVLTTELNAKGDGVLSTLGAAKTQTDTASGIWGYVWFKSGGAFTPTGTPALYGWWITSSDGGTSYEKASATPPRAADFIIPFATAAYAANDLVFAPGLVRLWVPTTKVLVLCNVGTTLPATGNTIMVGPVAVSF